MREMAQGMTLYLDEEEHRWPSLQLGVVTHERDGSRDYPLVGCRRAKVAMTPARSSNMREMAQGMTLPGCRRA